RTTEASKDYQAVSAFDTCVAGCDGDFGFRNSCQKAVAASGAKLPKDNSKEQQRQEMNTSRERDKGHRNRVGPIVLMTMKHGFVNEPILQEVEFVAGLCLLLERGMEASIEFRVAGFNLGSEGLVIGLGFRVTDKRSNGS